MQVGEGDTHAVAERVVAAAREWDRVNGHEDFPTERLRTLIDLGATAAFASLDDERAVDDLLAVLRHVGGADLSLGRIFEGHVNAAQLIHAYGTDAQRAALPGFVLPGDTSASDRYYRQDVTTAPFVLEDGHVAVPTGAGIGVDPDLDLLQELTSATELLTA